MTLTRKAFLGLMGTAAAAALTTTAASAQEYTLRLHQFLPAQANVPVQVLDVWADTIEEESGGRIEIQRYPAMQLGGTPPELYDQAVDGVADIVWTLPGYTPGRFPQTEVFELPFMMTDAEATSRAYWQLAEEQDWFSSIFSDVHVLGLWVHGPGVIHSGEPVTTPEDLAGVKLRAPTRVTNQLFTNLGATTVGMPVPAIPESLSKGVIDATVIPWEVTPSIRLTELVTNHTEFEADPLYTATFVLAMNQAAYDNLPEDLQQVIDDNSGLEFSAMAGATMQEYDAPGREIAVEAGNNIITLTEEQIEPWRAAADQTIENWVAEMDGQGLDGTALLDRARALIEENTSE
ncbi:TRAP transporter substrate-binding protein [Wenxinia marina]|uniref:TRAP-type C4-dicarboxylate transport system, periplasmic component n=1 Tax=Wenxinia marina DSM 24838 TaxID=1123501 RepID=A0A0D0PFQ7_9RHOB|nr:TRAP transporter substrate-binding protein [Wenxinia marina]KIQ70166.1 TRAP-type C4-dicarboxylate transport system, periplasmic component [Wenxinia marina DSM 24838]GGL50897.1 C4-dicarboxylate ABC transporter [Wenxinia marina]